MLWTALIPLESDEKKKKKSKKTSQPEPQYKSLEEKANLLSIIKRKYLQEKGISNKIKSNFELQWILFLAKPFNESLGKRLLEFFSWLKGGKGKSSSPPTSKNYTTHLLNKVVNFHVTYIVKI